MTSKNKRTHAELFEKNGRVFSKRTEYYDNGQVAMTGIFTCSQNDWSWNVAVGVVLHYYEDGVMMSSVGHDEYGARDGESLYYDTMGKLVKKQRYAKDILISQEILVEDNESID
jgi:hypothetical protein